MMQTFLEWHLDVIPFAILSFTAIYLVDRRYYSRAFGTRDRGAIRSCAYLLILGSIFLSIRKGENQRAQLRDAIDGFASTYAYEMKAAGHEKVIEGTAADDTLYASLLRKQEVWLGLKMIFSIMSGSQILILTCCALMILNHLSNLKSVIHWTVPITKIGATLKIKRRRNSQN